MIQLIKRFLVPVVIWLCFFCVIYSLYEAAKEQHKKNLLRKEHIYEKGVEKGLQDCKCILLKQDTIKQEKLNENSESI